MRTDPRSKMAVEIVDLHVDTQVYQVISRLSDDYNVAHISYIFWLIVDFESLFLSWYTRRLFFSCLI